MTLRTLETMQVQYLVKRFDFGKQSRVARLVAQMINDAMDAKDKAVGIRRAHPFELVIKKNHDWATLPLFLPEYLGACFKIPKTASSTRYIVDNVPRTPIYRG